MTSIKINETFTAHTILYFPVASRTFFSFYINSKLILDILRHNNSELISEMVKRKVILEKCTGDKKFFMVSDLIKQLIIEPESIFGPKQENNPGEYRQMMYTFIEELLIGVQDCVDDSRCCRLLL